MSRVEVRGLVRTYPGKPPVPALRGIDLDITSGGLTAVLGPSGCGKTTLLRTIAGFDRPDAGTVRIGDRLVAGEGRPVPPERRGVGIVPQEGALFPHLTVAANVAFGLPRAESRAERTRRVGEVLELVGLSGYEGRRPHELSGGQQQRVALARALAPRPAVVLLDEPFTALDASLRGALRAQVTDSLAAAEATALLVTHDQDEALSMATHLAVMRDGRIVQAGAPVEVYRRPVDVGVARFLGDAVLLPAVRRGATIECALGPIAAAPTGGVATAGTAGGAGVATEADGTGTGGVATVADGPVTACLRPEQLSRDDTSTVRAKVEAVHYQGHDALVELRLDGEALVARWPSFELPQEGDEVGLRVVGDAVAFPDLPA